MIDDYIKEQKIVCQILKNAVKKEKISHAYLFEMNGYSKKLEIAKAFAKMLLCPKNYSNSSKCENCVQCTNIDKDIFLELKIIQPDGLWIKKEQLDLLQKEFSTTSLESNKRVYIIMQADRLNPQAANSILKFLEEPQDNIVAILITDNMYQMLNTIISRCQVISFARTNKYNQTNMVDKIKNNSGIIINDNQLLDYVKFVFQYVDYYEKNKLGTILKNQKLWHNHFKEKNDIMSAFTIIILIYKDLLNFKVKSKIDIFSEYQDEIKNLADKNTIMQLNNKIKILLDSKNKLNYNVNIGLLMDKLVMDLERCDKDD